ncbi:energy transducer TonB [Cellvibrio sp. ARAG 10.3]|uniref:energy transducer TonB n=1 Tax=Cellvibrio sp. ARAG 10.3 TaxID=3451358 RepID=UPI003F4460BF
MKYFYLIALVLCVTSCVSAVSTENTKDFKPKAYPLPLITVSPVYPEQAKKQGIEGYVVIEYTVTHKGHPEDLKVIDSHPKGIFEANALKAASLFRYFPRKSESGEFVDTPNVVRRFDFALKN